MVQILDQYGKPFQSPRNRIDLNDSPGAGRGPRRANLRYDAAQDSDENKNYWASADAFDSDSANSLGVRQKLRVRSRYESTNNGYYAGIIGSHVNMLVGLGPSLRMLTGNREFNQIVEKAFYRWQQRCYLRRKLWCMVRSFMVDGEAFALIRSNPKFGKHQVQLDICPIEADQVTSATALRGPIFDPTYIDGIKFDEYGNIEWYDVLPYHPGATNTFVSYMQPNQVPPENMLHWFPFMRAGAHRGVPPLTPTMNLGAASRRWREAVLRSAETAADFTMFLKTQYQPEEMDDPAPMSSFEIQKRMMTVLPNSVEPFQVRAEQPTATHETFNRALISEQARPLHQPVNVAQGDSSNYSFASGKLDVLGYRLALDIQRVDCEDCILNPLFDRWFEEWTVMTDNIFTPNHQWDWPAHPVIDAVSEAQAVDLKLRNGTMPLRQAYSDQGQDLEDELSVIAEDYFGVADETTIEQVRQILLIAHFPAAQQMLQPAAPPDQFGSPMNGSGSDYSSNGFGSNGYPSNGAPTNGAPTNGYSPNGNGSPNGNNRFAPSLDQQINDLFAT